MTLVKTSPNRENNMIDFMVNSFQVIHFTTIAWLLYQFSKYVSCVFVLILNNNQFVIICQVFTKQLGNNKVMMTMSIYFDFR